MTTRHGPEPENLLHRLTRWLEPPEPHGLDVEAICGGTINAHLDLEPRTLLLVATPREGTATLGPLSQNWITVTQAVRNPDHIVPPDHRLTGWLATNTAKQHVDYHIAATHLDERTTP